MQISRKSLRTQPVEKMFQRLEGQRAKARNLQPTAQVKGEESLVEEIQERLCQQLVLSSKAVFQELQAV
ncbi:MLLT10 histone lysine methyltransferase DOT1L cofactor [Rhinolophus ferrumequinum]|uniref:MLLT10 histone lysine methyltransferase DOT1L cofactor n=1 Tax=Rhinolophus ferrumequinum TaxID=59479 RepID=A0A7J7ZDG5_RHIFE|nr:MLLT10 histone lysine methyltransferase DOT1L cofactor [Rhinolophus ferrumequinum]